MPQRTHRMVKQLWAFNERLAGSWQIADRAAARGNNLQKGTNIMG